MPEESLGLHLALDAMCKLKPSNKKEFAIDIKLPGRKHHNNIQVDAGTDTLLRPLSWRQKRRKTLISATFYFLCSLIFFSKRAGDCFHQSRSPVHLFPDRVQIPVFIRLNRPLVSGFPGLNQVHPVEQAEGLLHSRV